MTQSVNDVHYFGIRHHGPGSTQRLLSELASLQPAQILIEGPSDCSEEIQWLIKSDMVPPIALLAYHSDQSNANLFYPFADYSPEYQACLYALKHNVEVAFIDLPVAIQLASPEPEDSSVENNDNNTDHPNSDSDIEPPVDRHDTDEGKLQDVSRDPFARLAELSGYEDGESWWNDFIEQNAEQSNQVFELIESIMTELRAHTDVLDRDIQREAFMRLEIDTARKKTDGPIAVICGAWHVPGLREKHTVKANRDILKTLPTKLPKSKVRAAWVPWTSPRLASVSGYGAGVKSPQWYKHLWQHRDNEQCLALWLAKITQELRSHGYTISTASVIEAVRLYQTLASVRNKPSVGFEEIRDAVIACLCFGESVQWQQIEQTLLLGNDVGTIPADAPLIPLLDDLQKQQKSLKLKPEALQKNLSLDLRSQAGLAKSILLHRLSVLNVPWGKLTDSGSSRGTFRERWLLSWQPEFSVQLIENLAYGNTIELAANNKLIEAITQETQLNQLAQSVQLALEAHLHSAANVGLKQIDNFAAQTTDTLELLSSLPPLITIARYGTARELSLSQIGDLVERLTIQAALSLPYSGRNLNQEESTHYCRVINSAHQSVVIADFNEAVMNDWWQSLQEVMELTVADSQIRGLSARLLYIAEKIDSEQLQLLLQKMLSSSVAVTESAKFFEGFFDGVIDRLLFDSSLRTVVEQWLISLGEETFIEFLPLFRRVFSQLDTMERKRLIDTVLAGQKENHHPLVVNTSLISPWSIHYQSLSKLMRREKTWNQK